MIQRSVQSPGGQTIELVPDDDWVATTGASPRGLQMWNAGAKRYLIAALWEHGPFTDMKSGRAMRLLTNYISENYGVEVMGSAITTLILDNLNAPAIERTGKAKRTNVIKLVALPELWYQKLLVTLDTEIGPARAARAPVAPVVPEPVSVAPGAPQAPYVAVPVDDALNPVVQGATIDDAQWADITSALELDAPTVYATEGPPVELEIAQTVAMQLLTQVVEIIHAGSPEATDARVRKLTQDIADVQHNLGKRLEENQIMRRQLRDVGEELKAVRYERDGLRTRLRQTESNLKTALNGDAAKAVTAEVAKRIDQFMRAKPTPKGPDDA